MKLGFQTATQWVALQAAAVQGKCASLIDFSSGSVNLAIAQANASIAVWFQFLLLLILRTTRLATSTGLDVDSFLADFGLTRLPAVAASGYVTLSRFTPTGTATIPVGSEVKTGDLSVTYMVVADTTNPAYDATLFSGAGGFTIGAGVASINVLVVAETAGTVGNAQAGYISLLGSSIPGVDTVSNAADFVNGVDAQSDSAARALFSAFIGSLPRGTIKAIDYSIVSAVQGLTYTVAENTDEAGNFCPGKMVITIDDGTGDPPATTIAAVAASVDAYRAGTVRYAVHGPSQLMCSVAMTITVGPGAVKATLQPLVAQNITKYIANLSVGALLSITKMGAIAYSTHPAITNVSGITITVGGTAHTVDLVPSATQVIRVSAVTVS